MTNVGRKKSYEWTHFTLVAENETTVQCNHCGDKVSARLRRLQAHLSRCQQINNHLTKDEAVSRTDDNTNFESLEKYDAHNIRTCDEFSVKRLPWKVPKDKEASSKRKKKSVWSEISEVPSRAAALRAKNGLTEFISNFLGDIMGCQSFKTSHISLQQKIQHLCFILNLGSTDSDYVEILLQEHRAIMVSCGALHVTLPTMYTFEQSVFNK